MTAKDEAATDVAVDQESNSSLDEYPRYFFKDFPERPPVVMYLSYALMILCVVKYV